MDFAGITGALIRFFLAEKAREFNTPVYLAFLDLRKAYDLVNRDTLWMVLREKYLLPNKLVNIISSLHQGTRGAVRAYGRVSEEFNISTGVRQRCACSNSIQSLLRCCNISNHSPSPPTRCQDVVQPGWGAGGEPQKV